MRVTLSGACVSSATVRALHARISMLQAFTRDHVFTWLLAAVALHVLVNLAIVAGLRSNGYGLREANGATAPAQLGALVVPEHDTDSWYPMLLAYQRRMADPSAGLYAPFFEDGVKFQYPPSAILIVDLLPPAMRKLDGMDLDAGLVRWLIRLNLVGTVLTALVSVAMLDRRCRDLTGRRSAAARVAVAATGLVLAITFYPLLRAHALSQIQIFLNLMVALALLSHACAMPRAAGAWLGACCLFKPQLALVLVWSLLRRRWDVALGFLAVAVPVTAVALLRFGVADHLAYLEVLGTIARHGETFWANQSVNGLLNRLFENGDAIDFWDTAYAPYHPVVYVLTLLSSLALLALVLWPRAGARSLDGGLDDLLAVLAVATIASPVAWEHHYGVFLPICAASLPVLIERRPAGRMTAPLLAAGFAAMANVMLAPELIFANPVRGILGSHLFFGSLVVLAFLLAARDPSQGSVWGAGAAAASTPAPVERRRA